METEDKKTILLCLDVIEKSREVLVETLEKVEKFYFDDMPESGRHDIHGLDIVCQRIKNDLTCAENNTENMKESISADDEQEIEDAVIQIEEILLDDGLPPVSTKTFNPHSMGDVAREVDLG